MNPIKISAKTLGQLALPNFCPRCFWLRMKMGNKLPWQIFPGIFASIDSYSKSVVYDYWEATSSFPRWLDDGMITRPIPTPGHQQFWADDNETGIRLTGAADAIFRAGDGSYVILDFKTARYTNHQDGLLGMYQTQLCGYAWIAERRGFSPVSAIGLLYCEPVTKLTEERLMKVVRRDGFVMPFKVRGLQLPLEPETIPPLLRRAKDILDLPKPPERGDGCKDCQRVDALMTLIKGA